MSGIFINYRRADSEIHAKRIFNQLGKTFGSEEVFIDVAAIEVGDKFNQKINNALQSCTFLVVVIGKKWLTVHDEKFDCRRIDSPNDLLREELEYALDNQLYIIPVLVDGADMPQVDDLPQSIVRLARYQAIKITSKSSRPEVSKIATRIGAILDAREQKCIELDKALTELSHTPNRVLIFGHTRVIHANDANSGKTLRGSLTAITTDTLGKNLWEFVRVGVAITPFGDKKPFVSSANINWKIEADDSHIFGIVEDLLHIEYLCGNGAYEHTHVVVEKYLINYA